MRHPAALTLACLALAIGAATPAAAHGPRPHHHDGAFFMRLSGGFGFGSATLNRDQDTGFRGVGGQGSFAFGGNVARNLAIHADLFGISMFEPTVVIDGQDQGTAQDTNTSMGAIGVGITGYLMPLNLYLSASIGAGVGTVHTKTKFLGATIDIKEDTDPGLAVDLLVGKEWIVSRHWGLGLALQGMFAKLQTNNGDDFTVFSVGVLFSASLN